MPESKGLLGGLFGDGCDDNNLLFFFLLIIILFFLFGGSGFGKC